MDIKYKSTEELPISLNSDDVASCLNISKAGAYNLMNSQGFPSLRIGKRIVVPKEAFLHWMEANTGELSKSKREA
ncbi:helix-turn-helix domain-containing protein [Ruminiclostridium cellulolyticum]|uniref:Helix-turn-helix domain-containing protein n=1 Tax=Ruminiclostridium cellulolyticum (strain ATCC 35319 / DSM 5812 / JCM 6584 / H10) TaxID=394503 RepID=B8I352_RUMCH|nr:helix-turn-helix domain-containing protein [Ruminiclostridium cellulolyticum]ACL76195.1 hypothetical protein Ccel_1847 [Ruminiclostridium cellulolyticum H10]